MRPFPLTPSNRPVPVRPACRATAQPYPRPPRPAVRKCAAPCGPAGARPSAAQRAHRPPESAPTPA